MVSYACDPTTWRVKAGRKEGQSQLRSECVATLDYRRLSVKNN